LRDEVSSLDVHRQFGLQAANRPGILPQTALDTRFCVAVAGDAGHAHVHAETLPNARLSVFETNRTLVGGDFDGTDVLGLLGSPLDRNSLELGSGGDGAGMSAGTSDPVVFRLMGTHGTSGLSSVHLVTSRI